MDEALIKLSIQRLLKRVENLEEDNQALKDRLSKVESTQTVESSKPDIEQEDILLDTKEVLNILGISYNTLRAIVKDNLIVPIKINQRRVRYSKKGIMDYINSRTD